MPEWLPGTVGVLVGLVVGSIIGVLIGRALASAPRVAAEARLDEANRQVAEQRTRLDELGGQLSAARQDLARLEEANRQLAEQRKLLEDAKGQLGDAFRALSSEALRTSNEQFLALARENLEKVVAEARGDFGKRQEAMDGLIRPLQESLKRYEEQVASLEQKREKAYGSLEQQLTGVASTQQQLQAETRNLVTALRRPEVRGRWGEITLTRVVEVAGLSEHCDFEVQATVSTETGVLRPDLTVRLPNERTIVVDVKAPVDAYIDAVEAPDEAARTAALQRHARHVREHVQKLSLKAYWDQFPRAPDFVVLFLPGESFFSAALEQDRDLIESAIKSKVIARISREFAERVATFAGHLGRIRDGLDRASKAYNEAVASWQARVVPSGRRVAELGGAGRTGETAELAPVEVALRELPAAEAPSTEAEAEA
jgi:DNA recombination protein RmuC